MASFDLYTAYQRIIYIILHYCSFWTILTCILSASISWRLFTILHTQNSSTDDAFLAWWTTAVWGSAAILFFLVGLLFT